MIGGKRYISGRHQRTHLPLILVGLVVLVIASGGVIIWENHRKTSSVDPSIAKQLTFSPFVLSKNSGVKVLSQKYDAGSQVYFLIIQTLDGQKLTVSEQSTPVNLSEIPELYTKLLDGLHKYTTLETINGTVSLTRPQENETTAVMNERGVLMFVRADEGRQLSVSQWKHIIESFETQRIKD